MPQANLGVDRRWSLEERGINDSLSAAPECPTKNGRRYGHNDNSRKLKVQVQQDVEAYRAIKLCYPKVSQYIRARCQVWFWPRARVRRREAGRA